MSNETDVLGVNNSPSTELSVAEDNLREVNKADPELSSDDLECVEGEDGTFMFLVGRATLKYTLGGERVSASLRLAEPMNT